MERQQGMMLPLIPWEEITLVKKIGEGGFGVVHKASWKHGGEVAIKQIKGTLGADAAEEFRQEAEVMARMNSPYIIRLFGLCWDHQKYGIVMELMPNASLYDLLHNGKALPWDIRYRIAQDMAYGLRLLHDRGIIHRDLKSLNVLLDTNLRAKLTDFGLAKVKTQSKSTSEAREGSIGKREGSVGTVAWMAPELFGIKPKYSRSSDVYAYGITAWELASREIPYSGVNYEEVKSAVKQGEREDLPSDCPADFAALIEGCWSQEASSRLTIDKVVSHLEGILEGQTPLSMAGVQQALPAAKVLRFTQPEPVAKPRPSTEDDFELQDKIFKNYRDSVRNILEIDKFDPELALKLFENLDRKHVSNTFL